jgi:acetylornithine/succinyldiaminopimelate/putrescine aminotransferase
MMALDFGDSVRVQHILKLCLEKGLLADWFLYADDCIRIAPPLIISEKEITEACSILHTCIAESAHA